MLTFGDGDPEALEGSFGDVGAAMAEVSLLFGESGYPVAYNGVVTDPIVHGVAH